MRSIAVVGGGIAGLAAAWELRENVISGQLEVDLLESTHRLGGAIETDLSSGNVIEGGPDSFMARRKEAGQLCHEAGLDSSMIGILKGGSYMFHSARFHPIPPVTPAGIPVKLSSFRSSNLFTLRGKARALCDLIIPRTPELKRGEDISVGAFLRRRLGSEIVDYLVGPIAGGTHLTTIDELSLRATFPNLVNMERRHRSLILGIMREKDGTAGSTPGKQSPFTTLDCGLSSLVEALASQLPPVRVILSAEVTRIERGKDEKYTIGTTGHEARAYDGVVVAAPAYAASQMFHKSFPELATSLDGVHYSPVVVVGLVYDPASIPMELDRSGFMVPRGEGLSISGVTWASSKWEYRIAGRGVSMRVFLDGRTHSDITVLTDEEILGKVGQDLKTTMAITSKPVYSRIFRHPRAMPRYRTGHLEWVRSVMELTSRWPSLALAGAPYQGVGLSDCIRSGRDAARSVETSLGTALNRIDRHRAGS